MDPGEPREVLRDGRISEATVCPENRAKTELQLLEADKQVNTTEASSNPSDPYLLSFWYKRQLKKGPRIS